MLGFIPPGSKSIGVPCSSLKIYQLDDLSQDPHRELHTELNEGHLLHLPSNAAGSVPRTQSPLPAANCRVPALSAALLISHRDIHALQR